ncbi:transposase [Kutzneria sp. NPDC052558]|uniref:transposase n=1 Tax=Kutzneria sp. NPDC052558 TaxID=3364121 RepID=UPI0037C55480
MENTQVVQERHVKSGETLHRPASVAGPLPSELTDASWQRIHPLIPTSTKGRPPRDHRQTIDGILWKLRTNHAWHAIPARYGNGMTIYSHYRKRVDIGVCVASSKPTSARRRERKARKLCHHSLKSGIHSSPHACLRELARRCTVAWLAPSFAREGGWGRNDDSS